VLEGEGVMETPLEHIDAGKAEVIFDANVKEDENDGHTLRWLALLWASSIMKKRTWEFQWK
jgi:hypothetical protein